MIPASQAATSQPPYRGATATTTPASTSTTPTAYIACWAVPGTSPSIQGARYCGQSVRRLVNLSRPKAIGATVNTVRSSRNAWCAGSAAGSAARDRVRWTAMATSSKTNDDWQ
jgi:hypothetical protein